MYQVAGKRVIMRKSGFYWLWVTGIVIILDRVTKWTAEFYLIPYTSFPVLKGFNLTLSFNKGAAFSFLDKAPGWQVWFFGGIAIVVSIAIFIWLWRISSREKLLAIALTLILGGALGNLWDRISYGHVIDFIELYVSHFYWPAFNIADSAICVGAVLLLIHTFFHRNSHSIKTLPKL